MTERGWRVCVFARSFRELLVLCVLLSFAFAVCEALRWVFAAAVAVVIIAWLAFRRGSVRVGECLDLGQVAPPRHCIDQTKTKTKMNRRNDTHHLHIDFSVLVRPSESSAAGPSPSGSSSTNWVIRGASVSSSSNDCFPHLAHRRLNPLETHHHRSHCRIHSRHDDHVPDRRPPSVHDRKSMALGRVWFA